MGCCFEVLRDNGTDWQGVLQRFESHGWRSWMVPLRRGGRSVKASGLSVRVITQSSYCHTLFVHCPDGIQ